MEGLISKNTNYITGELRAYNAPYVDPLVTNFKLLFNFDSKHGLLANEKYINSALNYLKRIGEEERYNLLKRFLELLKDFNKNYDFLILNVEGIDTIINAKPHEAYKEDDKIVINMRETIDMRIQTILTLYRRIWYDNERSVEVLPINLRQFDLSILIYAAGYYNMMLYDKFNYEGNIIESSESDIDRNIFPTLRKLSDNFFYENSTTPGFNHIIVNISMASINNEDSGKPFFSQVSNEPGGEIIKNLISLNFRYADYDGSFNNLVGEFQIGHLLALAAAQDLIAKKIINEGIVEDEEVERTKIQQLMDKTKTKGIDYFNNGKKLSSKYINKHIYAATPIGNAFALISGTIKDPKDTLTKQYTKYKNLVVQNFSDKFIDAYKTTLKNFVQDKEKLLNGIISGINDGINTKSNTTLEEKKKNIEYKVSNIYKRTTF